MRIVCAMSGGVDSSVAAALLADAGHDVIGVSMQLYDQQEGQTRFGTCCTIDDLHDARRTSAALGIPHYVMNFERQFDTHVVRNFVDEYVNGRTPIPCTHCNGDLKFTTLLERAGGLGAEALATGHYARVDFDAACGRYRLLRGVDRSRDQSYFLFALSQDQLARAQFPVGSLPKSAVREYARTRRLPVADKPDSREICFVTDGHYADFVERHAKGRMGTSGAILDEAGHMVGAHRGVHRYTVGQRKGLGLSSTIPLYVLEIDATAQRLVVGPRAALERTTLTARDVNWIAGMPPSASARVSAQVRYAHRAAPATLTPLSDAAARLVFDAPQPAIAPGQAVVFYQEDEVVGGGWIDTVER
jgi:tRNA-uridine 2-sulfurtransferase